VEDPCPIASEAALISSGTPRRQSTVGVFTVNTNPNLDVGFNVWNNGNGTYTGFIAGNSAAVGQNIIYLGETGALTAVPEASTWAMMLVGFAGLGFAGFYRSRRSSVPALA
jgi:hypothetical protein